MKTNFYFLFAAFASFFVITSASAQYHRGNDEPYNRGYDDPCRNDRQQSFYYYPQSNVYYSFTTGKYIFYDRNAWIVSERLPRHYRLRDEPRFVVCHDGFDVWNANRFHAMKYRDYRRFSPDVAYDHQGRYDDHNRPDIRDNDRRR